MMNARRLKNARTPVKASIFPELMNPCLKAFLMSSLLVPIVLTGCGARLDPVAKLNRPIATEEFVDLDAVQLTKLQDGSPVNIGQYMRDQKLPWLVLAFGSKSCGICMEKARYLQANLVDGNYAALGLTADPRNKVEVIGVFTDPQAMRDELLGLVSDEKSPLPLLSWFDPGHEVMMKYFQSAGRSFTVPLTVMLSPRGIVWRINSNDKISHENLILKIANTISNDANRAPPPPVKPPVASPPVNISLLAAERPDRLNGAVVTSCVGGSQSVLGDKLPPVANGLRAVLVHKDSCAISADCVEAKSALKAWRSDCLAAGARDCGLKELVIGENLCTDDPDLFAGGSEFFETFSDHFNWSYRPLLSRPGRIKLPEVKGPLTLVFDDQGRLVFSKEGALADSLTARMAHDQMKDRAAGPEFSLAWNQTPLTTPDANVAATFSDVRAHSKYTMVMFWNTFCSSCTEEIQQWHSEPDSAFNYCNAHKDFCQVTAIETETDGSSPQDYLKSLILWDGTADDFSWQKNRWPMPLMVEGVPLPGGLAPLGWYSGWFRARFGSSEPRVVLFDREGKVVNSWNSLPGDHGARDAIRSMFEGGL
jgi:thiol-disulfide isomerase/thioredoxin